MMVSGSMYILRFLLGGPPKFMGIPMGRRDTYEKNLRRYFVEKEWLGEREHQVRSDHTRSLNMNDMGPDDFDDNDRFGDTTNLASESDPGSSDYDSSDADDSRSAGSCSEDLASKRGEGSAKKLKKGKGKRAKSSKGSDNLQKSKSRRLASPESEEPLEDPIWLKVFWINSIRSKDIRMIVCPLIYVQLW